MPFEQTPWHYPAGTDQRYLDGDECPHGEDPRDCEECTDADQAAAEEAAEQRADALRDRGF